MNIIRSLKPLLYQDRPLQSHGPCLGRTKKTLMILMAGSVLASTQVASAVDTLELFDPGFSDFELYFAYSGLGKEEPERGLGAETVIGVGIGDWLSGFARASGQASEKLTDGTGEIGFGAYGTPIDTAHFDLDVGIDIRIGNLGGGEDGGADLGFTPFLELNLDSDPDMQGYGCYTFVEQTFGGQVNSYIGPLGEEIRDFSLKSGTGLTVGAYYTILEGHQLLAAYTMNLLHNHDPDERVTEIGGLALGYNFTVIEPLEFITEVNFDIPQDDEDFGVDFLVGFIATLK